MTPWEWRRGERVPVVIGIDHGVEAEQAPLVTTRGPFAIKHGVMHDDTRTVVPIDTTETGSWNNTSLHLLAHSPTVAFGVASRDRSLEAWAYGQQPSTDIHDNAALSHTATSTGPLLGFTFESAAVTGAPRVTFNLTALHGTAIFMHLESWPNDQSRGRPGAGAVWLGRPPFSDCRERQHVFTNRRRPWHS